MDLAFLTIAELSRQIAARAVSPVEVVQLLIERADRLEPQLNSFITLTAEAALEAARRAEQEIAAGRYRGPLHGVPVSLKDLIDTRGVRTTSGSKILADNVPAQDATIAARLVQAGAIILGKNNTAEFACGTTTENAHYGPARNPWGLDRVPGGSSGGSGAAVAAGLAYGSIGTDTGGSVRIPAALCGLAGLRPTYGRISRYGVFPLAWSLDCPGPLARTVEDVALMLQAIAGYDPRDPASANQPVPDFRVDLDRGVAGLRIGVPTNYFYEDADPEVESAVRAAIDRLQELGAICVPFTLPGADQARDVHTTIMNGEGASVHLQWLQTRPQDYGPDVRNRLELGATLLAVDYIQAQRVRSGLQAEFGEVLARFDLLATPTTPVPATRIGETDRVITETLGNPRFALARATCVFSQVGLPAISVPCGFTRAGLPIGLQLAGRPFDEATVLRAAHTYERSEAWYRRHPEIAVEVGAG